MLPDRVSNPGPLTYESGALPIAHPTNGKLSLSTQQQMVPLSIQGRKRQRKERDRFPIQWGSNPRCPYGYQAMGNLT